MDSTKAQPADYTEQSLQTLNALLARSASDMTFRRTLLSDPRAAVAEFRGTDASTLSNARVVFVENHADATIVLPPFAADADELSERDLEAVAGGTDPVTLSIIATVIGTAIVTHQAGWW